MGLNVETYQISKKSCGSGSGSGGDIQEILDRLGELEKTRFNIKQEFFDNFKTYKNVDMDKSTVLFDENGFTVKTFKDVKVETFKDNSGMDYDSSTNVEWSEGGIYVTDWDNQNSIGEFISTPHNVDKVTKFKFSARSMLTEKNTYNALKRIDNIKNDKAWFLSETDNYGKLWVFHSNKVDKSDGLKILLNIYNKDLSVFKENVEIKIENNENETLVSGGTIVFDDNNDCYITLNRIFDNNMRKSHNDIYKISEKTFTVDKMLEDDSTSIVNCISKPFVHDGGMIVPLESVFGKHKQYSGRALNENDGYESEIYFVDKSKNKVLIDKGFYTKFLVEELIRDYYYCYPFEHTLIKKHNKLFMFTLGECIVPDENDDENKLFNYKNIHPYIVDINLNKSLLNSSCSEITVKDGDCNDDMPDCISGGSLSGYYYLKDTEEVIFIKSNRISKYKIDFDKKEMSLVKRNDLVLKKESSCLHKIECVSMKVCEDKFNLYVLYLSKYDEKNKESLRFVAINKEDLSVVEQDSLIYCCKDTRHKIKDFDIKCCEDNIYTIYSVEGEHEVVIGKIEKELSMVTYYYSTDTDTVWKNINSGDTVLLDVPASELKIKAILDATNTAKSPLLKAYNLEFYRNGSSINVFSDFYTKRIPIVNNYGKLIFAPNQNEGEGRIDWYISYDSGLNYKAITPHQEINYSFIEANDCRLKATLTALDSCNVPPRVFDYRIKTEHVVTHSDFDEVKVNLIKTNFKIDTYAFVSKNGLYKMTIDTFNDTNGINSSQSDFIFDMQHGKVYGKYITSLPEVLDSNVKTFMLITDELKTDSENYINYFFSIDNGETYNKIIPGVKVNISNVNTNAINLTVKAVFTGHAELTSWGWAWE